MAALSDKVAWYLAAQKTPHVLEAYRTIQKEGHDEELGRWDEATLGARPTMDQLEVAVPPPPPPPKFVANWRGRIVLSRRGYEDTIIKAIEGIKDDDRRVVARIAFERADFPRDSPLLNDILSGLGLDEDQKDDLFREAEALSF